MLHWLLQLVGLGLVALALLDIYLTVLSPRLGTSLLSLPLMKKIWWLFRQTARLLPKQRQQLLFHAGPLMIVAVILVWVTLLAVGFALIVWPALGTEVQASQGQTSRDFWTALYYSGYSLTTLGNGDLIPQTEFYRFLTLVQAALGFSIFTLTITYLLSVYNALIQRNSFALSLHHRSDTTADAAELLARLMAGGSVDGLQQDLSNMARDLMNLLEAQHSYPVLLFFRFQPRYYGMPRLLLLLLDTATLIKSGLDAEQYRSLVNSAAVAELSGGSLQMLDEVSRTILSSQRRRTAKRSQLTPKQWQQRYLKALNRLEAEGIKVVSDVEAGAELYMALRADWQGRLSELADYLGYSWSEVAPQDTES